jgi:hypothetical protein
VGYSVGTSYSGSCARTAPIRLNYKGLYARQFDPDGASTGLMVTAEPRDWVDGAWVAHEWACGDDYSQLQFPKSELWQYEYRFLSEGGTCAVTQASRVTAGEDVGGTAIAQNDAQCAILCQGLSSGITGEPHWAGWLSLAHTASIDVNDPPGAATRPSLWTAGAGVTVDGAHNDKWTGAGTVSRALASLYPLRMARLASGWVPGDEYGTDWPYILRRARAGETAATFGDDPAWWAALPNGEDVWNWSNYSYLAVGITAPAPGTVTLTLTVQVPTLYDPCYTSAADRWGEFTFTQTERTFTYSVAVVAGANAVQVDLCKPNEGMVPEGDYRLCRVSNVQFTLPETGEWTLTDLRLCEDENNAVFIIHHDKRPWSWRSSNWMYFCAIVDGKPALQVHPGFLRMDEEWGMQGLQFAQHDPDSEATDELTYAKAHSRLAAELDWQEGYTCTWGDPLSAANNTDADDIAFAPGLYWWDHQHQEQSSTSGCVATGHLNWVYGAEYDVYYSVFPRGEVCGLVFDDAGQRVRSTGTVWLYRSATSGGTYSRIGDYATNSQGLWFSNPVLEKSYFYGVSPTDLGATCAAGSLQASGFTAANREYTFISSWAELPGALWDPFVDADRFGQTWVAAETSGVVKTKRRDAVGTWQSATAPFGETSGHWRPSITILPTGHVLAAATYNGGLDIARSVDHGGAWEVVTMAGQIGEGLQYGTVWSNKDGDAAACGWDEARGKIVFHLSTQTDLSRNVLTAPIGSPPAAELDALDVCDAVPGEQDPPPRSSVCQGPDGAYLVTVGVGGSMVTYRCRDFSKAQTDGAFETV